MIPLDRQPPENPGPADHLEWGRRHYEQRAWHDAYEALALADRAAPLATDDLERLAMSAYLIGREEDFLRALERAHRAYLDVAAWTWAARGAFWIGLCLLFRGETGPATGWLNRAQRLVEREGRACAEEGYLLVAEAERSLAASDTKGAYEAAAKAVEIGDRFAEPDLTICARHVQGRALLEQGQVEQGLALLDESMVAVVEGDLSPRMTGLVYCSVIDSCMRFYAFARAREWTFALSRWCEEQPQLVTFTRTCLVHRAEIMELNGAWPDAVEEARRACSNSPAKGAQPVPAAAFYRRGELHRLRGEFAAAEEAFREASRRGLEPQPGLALLRLAQGKVDAAAIAIRCAIGAIPDDLQRARLLPACIEIMLAAGSLEEARRACGDLEEIAGHFGTDMLLALAEHACGSIALTEGNAKAALCSLRRAFAFWHKIGAPYPAARARELVGLACRQLGDEEGAQLELQAARAAFNELRATPDLDRLASRPGTKRPEQSHGLTRRELQVLRLISAGMTNKSIAFELCVSPRTVDRHVANLFNKIDVSSRAAATSYAHRRKLI